MLENTNTLTDSKLYRKVNEILAEMITRRELSLPQIHVGYLPISVHVNTVVAALTSDALSSYTDADGDRDAYVEWVIRSALTMIAWELATGKIRDNYVLSNFFNFYKKITDTFSKNKNYEDVTKRFHIPMNIHMINKMVEITGERIL